MHVGGDNESHIWCSISIYQPVCQNLSCLGGVQRICRWIHKLHSHQRDKEDTHPELNTALRKFAKSSALSCNTINGQSSYISWSWDRGNFWISLKTGECAARTPKNTRNKLDSAFKTMFPSSYHKSETNGTLSEGIED